MTLREFSGDLDAVDEGSSSAPRVSEFKGELDPPAKIPAAEVRRANDLIMGELDAQPKRMTDIEAAEKPDTAFRDSKLGKVVDSVGGALAGLMGGRRTGQTATGGLAETPSGQLPGPVRPKPIAMPGSVVDGALPTGKPQTIQDVGGPASTAFVEQTRAAMERMTPAQRTALASGQDMRGAVARKILEGWAAQDASAAKTPAMANATGRVEDRASRLAIGGFDPNLAPGRAQAEANLGIPERPDGAVRKSEFDFDARAEWKDSTAGARGLEKGRVLVGKQFTGAARFISDVLGTERVSERLGEEGDRMERYVEGMGESKDFLVRNFEGAVASTLSNLPALAFGVMTGSAVPALAVMGMQVFGEEYNTGRQKNLDMADATARASMMAAAEVVGEQFGLGYMLKGLRAAADGVATPVLAKFFAQHMIREIPGEQLTTALQFSTDKFASFGLNKQATLADYLNQVKDTFAQTVMQGAIMSGGAIGAGAGIRRLKEGSARWDELPEDKPAPGALPPLPPAVVEAVVADKPAARAIVTSSLVQPQDGSPYAVQQGAVQGQVYADGALPQETEPVSPVSPASVEPEAESVTVGDGTRTNPVVVTTPEDIVTAEAQVNTEPTEAQKEAGNYAKAHVDFQGFNISIENPKGSERTGTGPDGTPWSVTMPATYGYLKRTEGADGDQVDVYLGDKVDAKTVFVIDQIDPATGKFDEHKVMMGFPTIYAAREAYEAGFSDGQGKARLGAISTMPVEAFRDWMKTGDTTAPMQYQPKAESRKVEGGKVIARPLADKTTAETPPSKPQPGDANYTLLDARNDLIDLRSRVWQQGRVADDRLAEKIRQLEKLVRDMEASESAAPAQKSTQPLNVIKTPTGKWLYVGRIPDQLAFKEGATPKQISDAKQFGERFGPGKRLFDSRDEAVAAANALGFEVYPEPEAPAAPEPGAATEPASATPVAASDAASVSADDFDALINEVQAERKAPEPIRVPRPDGGRPAVGDLIGVSLEGTRKIEAAQVVESPRLLDRNMFLVRIYRNGQFGEPVTRLTKNVHPWPADVPKPDLSVDAPKAEQATPKKPAGDRSAAQRMRKLREHFTPGNIIRSDYWQTFDRVISFDPGGERGWSVRVEKVEKRGDEWVAIEQSRQHSTMPSEKDVIVERAQVAATAAPKTTRATKQPATRAASEWTEIGKNDTGQTLYEDQRGVRSYVENGVRQTESVRIGPDGRFAGAATRRDEYKTSAEMGAAALKDAATSAAAGVKEGFAGLDALFGRKGTLGSGPAFDEDTWQKAKPHFEAAFREFVTAGKSLKEFVRYILDSYNDAIVPYLKRWHADQSQPGEENGLSGSSQQGEEALGAVAAEEDGGTEGAGDVLGGDTSSSGESAGGDRPADGDGLSAARGGGSGAADVRDPAPRARGRRAGTGTGRARGRVSKGDAGTPGTAVSPSAAPNLPGTNFVITDEVRLGQGGEAEKFRDNLAAIRTLKTIEAEKRRATPDEQRILARYVGWGGLANAFASPTGEFKPDWQARGEELAGLLTKQELDAARRSTRNAHYTSQPIIEAIWTIAQRMGFRGGLALEPSSGSGSFLGLVPKALAGDTKFIGVEYDSLTARMSQALYPQSTILHSGFQKVPLADGAFDLVIGNPPFGSESLRFQYKPELNRLSIHNQFFVGGIDALKAGGVEVMVVSRYLMDAKDSTARRMLAERGRLLGVIRLPDTAFKENARTEVVTDIIILQRHTPSEEAAMVAAFNAKRSKPSQDRDGERIRQEAAALVPDWVETTEIADPLGGEPMTVNTYFARNPEMVVGRLERSGKMQFERDAEGNKAGGVNVKLAPGQNLEALLSQAIDRLPSDVMNQGNSAIAASVERYAGMADGLKIALSGQEVGHVEKDADGKLVQVVERETPEGDYEMQKRVLTAESPWSDQLMMDSTGRWYMLTPQLDDKGQPVKMMKGDVATKRNVYIRKTFEKDADIPTSMRLGKLEFERLGMLSDLRDLLKNQLVIEAEDAAAKEMEANRRKLAAAYRAFVKEHSHINTPRNAKLISNMPDGALLLSLEHGYRPEITRARAAKSGQKARPASAQEAPILSQRVIPKYEPATKADTPADALAITTAESGRVDMARIAGLLGITEEQAVAQLQAGDKPMVFRDPEANQWETADAYLSGQVKRKLNAAREAGMEINVKALEAVQPELWGSENVTARIGATWIPGEVYASFITHLTGEPARVAFAPVTNAFQVTATSNSIKAKAWATEEVSVQTLVSNLLNSQSTRVTFTDTEGKTHVNQEATDLAQMKAKEIAAEFEDWVFNESDRRGKLVEIFNEKFNTRVIRQHDGSHLKLPGKVPDEVISMRRHQMNAIWRGISERFMLIDHVVGAGKSFTAIARAMERRRMGLSRKPTIVVPNHLVESWAAEVYRLYPGAKVLAAGKKDFERSRRRKIFAKVATGDWDIVILPHSSFGFIGISPETEGRFLEEELRIANQAIEDAKEQAEEDGNTGFRKPFNVKEAERLAEKLQNRIDGLADRKRDRLLTFEQMGIDDLTVDEAHEFKNLFYNSRLTGVRGMGDKSGSAKAFDLYNKVRVLRESPTGTVTFMTGTPISNSAVEMYTMMRYLAADVLQGLGLEHFDAWRAQFVEATTKWEPNEANKLTAVNRLGRSWSNMRSLMDMYYSFTDAVSQEDITRWYAEDNDGAAFPIPKVKGGERRAIVVKPTPAQEAILGEVIAGFDGLPGIKDPYARNAERLRLMDRARKVSLDARAVDRRNPSTEEGGKLQRVSEEAARIYKGWHADRGTQLIFLDRSVPNSKGDDKVVKAYDQAIAERDAALTANDEDRYRRAVEALDKFDMNEVDELRAALQGGWNSYEQIKRNLVAMGIPADEVRFIQEANDDAQKKAMFDAVNDGTVRILIGSTPRMGAGTNVQQRLVALHHVDVTWKPSDIEQREGRIIRQGNGLRARIGDSFEVEILTYVTERTVDAKLWDVNSSKLRMINGIRKYTGEFNMDFPDDEAVGMAEIAALASGDPLLLERVKLTAEIDQLDRMRRAHTRKINGLDDARRRAEKDIERLPGVIEDIKARAKMLTAEQATLAEEARGRSVTIEGKTFGSRFEADQFVSQEIEKQKAGDENAKYALNVNGSRFTNKAGIESAIANALGDVEPFSATIEGEKVIGRGAASKAILDPVNAAAKLLDEAGATQTVPLGQWYGLVLEADLERNESWQGKPEYRLTLSLSTPDGRTVSSQVGDRLAIPDFTTQYVRGLLQKVETTVQRSARNDASWEINRLKQAQEELPTLVERAKEKWPKQAELDEKSDRLEKVIKMLSGTDSPTTAAANEAAFGRPSGPMEYDMAGESAAVPGLPSFSRGSDKFRTVKARNGEPVLTTDEIVLGYPRRVAGRPDVSYILLDRAKAAQAMKAGEDPREGLVGRVELEVDTAGNVTGITSIFLAPTAQRGGYGEKIVRAVLASMPDGAELKVSNVLPESRGFWSTMGARFEPGRLFDDGYITRGSYERSRTPIQDAGGSQGLVFRRGEAGSQPGQVDARGTGRPETGDGARTRTEEVDAQSPADAGLVISRVLDAIGDTASRLSVPVAVYADAAEASRALGFEIPGDVWGVNYRGKVSLIANNLTTPEAVEFTLWHELFHTGMESIMKADGFEVYADALQRVAMSNANVRQAAFTWRQKYGLEEAAMLRQFGAAESQIERRVLLKSWEEAIADISGTNPNLRNLDRLIAALQMLVRKVGLHRLAAWMEGKTNAEALALVRQSRNALMPNGAMVMRGDGMPAMAREPGGTMASMPANVTSLGRGAWDRFDKAREQARNFIIGVGLDPGDRWRDIAPYRLLDEFEAMVQFTPALTRTAEMKAMAGRIWAELESSYRAGARVDRAGAGLPLEQEPAATEDRAPFGDEVGLDDAAEISEAESLDEAKYIMPDGRLIGSGDESHEYIASAMQGEGTEPAQFQQKSGAVRLNIAADLVAGRPYTVDVQVQPTQAQFDKIVEYISMANGPVVVTTPGSTVDIAPGSRVGMLLRKALADVPAPTMSFSRGPLLAQTREVVGDLLHSDRTFNRWWHKTVGTQYHKAQIDPHFGRAFNAGQDFLNDVSLFSMRAESAAPGILLSLETFGDIFTRRRMTQADSAKVGEALFQGTLDDQVYTDDELRTIFGFSDKQVELYRQARGAINLSLDELTKSQFGKMAKAIGVPHAVIIEAKDTDFTLAQFHDRIRRRIDAMIEVNDFLNAAERNQDTIDRREEENARFKAQRLAITRLFNKVTKLKMQGYAPLMRFGHITVNVMDEDGNRVYFGMYESQFEANRAARAFREDMPDATVTTGTLSQEQFRLFQGLTPETVALFAENSGLEKDALFQEFLRLAVNNRSALKRLIHRKKTPGFSPDVARVLAQFVTSNARVASANYHIGEMSTAIDDIPQRKGDVKDEAVNLRDYLINPVEEAAAIRGFLFFNFLGGSIAAAIVNATQPVTMTAPYLTKFASDIEVTKQMALASMEASKNAPGADVADAYKRAQDRGIIAPHEIHQLMAEARGAFQPTGLGRMMGSQYARGVSVTHRFMKAWGGFFSLAEAFNRRISFIAAYRIAVGNRHPDPYEFAVQAVYETQGLYNKGNRPNWARGAVGATLFTFKQFSIHYIEWLKRLPAPQRIRALVILFLVAGINGLPFAEDIEDIIDAIGQWMGYGTNTKKWLRQNAANVLGEGAGQFVNQGISAFLPLDVSARMGLGNLIPGTAMFKRSSDDKGRDIAEWLGPAGSVAERTLKGQFKEAFLPKAYMDAEKGLKMALTGEYRNPDGNLIARDVTVGEGVTKAIGFNPARVAEQGRKVWQNSQDIRLTNLTEARIAKLWARGVVEKDPSMVAEARRQWRDWNAKNPDMKIKIEAEQIKRRVRELRKTREDRAVQRASREIRGGIAKDVRE